LTKGKKLKRYDDYYTDEMKANDLETCIIFLILYFLVKKVVIETYEASLIARDEKI
jgi:hypothetical protein